MMMERISRKTKDAAVIRSVFLWVFKHNLLEQILLQAIFSNTSIWDKPQMFRGINMHLSICLPRRVLKIIFIATVALLLCAFTHSNSFFELPTCSYNCFRIISHPCDLILLSDLSNCFICVQLALTNLFVLIFTVAEMWTCVEIQQTRRNSQSSSRSK